MGSIIVVPIFKLFKSQPAVVPILKPDDSLDAESKATNPLECDNVINNIAPDNFNEEAIIEESSASRNDTIDVFISDMPREKILGKVVPKHIEKNIEENLLDSYKAEESEQDNQEPEEQHHTQTQLTDSSEEVGEDGAFLKMAIVRKKTDNVYSILRIYDPNDRDILRFIMKNIPSSTTTSELHNEPSMSEETAIPIQPVVRKEILSPLKHSICPCPKVKETKLALRLNTKPAISQSFDSHHHPEMTIKHIVKQPEEPEGRSSMQVSIKPQNKEEEDYERLCPRTTIKPIIKPPDEGSFKPGISNCSSEEKHSPRITIKPVVSPLDVQSPDETIIPIKTIIKQTEESAEESDSSRITIKPIIKPPEVHSPRITIKPIVNPQEISKKKESVSHSLPFKLNIKPAVKPAESNLSPTKTTIKQVAKPPEPKTKPLEQIGFKEPITFKIGNNSETASKLSLENEELKINLKLSKEHSLTHIIETTFETIKHTLFTEGRPELKRFKPDLAQILSISVVPSTTDTSDLNITVVEGTEQSEPVKPEEAESSSSECKEDLNCSGDIPDPLDAIPFYEIIFKPASASPPALPPAVADTSSAPTARKRGHPKTTPLVVGEKTMVPAHSRPKRICQRKSALTLLGIKHR